MELVCVGECEEICSDEENRLFLTYLYSNVFLINYSTMLKMLPALPYKHTQQKNKLPIKYRIWKAKTSNSSIYDRYVD